MCAQFFKTSNITKQEVSLKVTQNLQAARIQEDYCFLTNPIKNCNLKKKSNCILSHALLEKGLARSLESTIFHIVDEVLRSS